MALTPSTGVAARNLGLDAAFPAALNSGHLLVYDGVIPTTADTALGAQVLLADLILNSTAFAAATAGSKTANAITQDSAANATGTASWMTVVATTRATVGTIDGSAGTATTNLVLNSTAISINAAVSCSSLVISQAA